MVEAQPVRLAFRTTATTVELDVLPTKTVYKGAPAEKWVKLRTPFVHFHNTESDFAAQ